MLEKVNNMPTQLTKLKTSPTKISPNSVANTASRLRIKAAFEASTILCPYN